MSRTSPLGTGAHSMPANAKINRCEVRATSAAAGAAVSVVRPASEGTSNPALDAKTVETAAPANVPSIHNIRPEMKPA